MKTARHRSVREAPLGAWSTQSQFPFSCLWVAWRGCRAPYPAAPHLHFHGQGHRAAWKENSHPQPRQPAPSTRSKAWSRAPSTASPLLTTLYKGTSAGQAKHRRPGHPTELLGPCSPAACPTFPPQQSHTRRLCNIRNHRTTEILTYGFRQSSVLDTPLQNIFLIHSLLFLKYRFIDWVEQAL